MIDSFSLALAFFTGALLGVFFFGGLWWTVQKGVNSDWPAVWFLSSLLVRIGVILMGFVFISKGHWIKLVACFFGFLLIRFAIVTGFTRAMADDRPRVELEAQSAP